MCNLFYVRCSLLGREGDSGRCFGTKRWLSFIQQGSLHSVKTMTCIVFSDMCHCYCRRDFFYHKLCHVSFGLPPRKSCNYFTSSLMETQNLLLSIKKKLFEFYKFFKFLVPSFWKLSLFKIAPASFLMICRVLYIMARSKQDSDCVQKLRACWILSW